MQLEFHHSARKITKNSLELVLDLFSILDCELTYRVDNEKWALVKPKNKDIRIQLIESDDYPLKTEIKKNSHLGFISDDPKKELEKIKRWVEKNNVKFIEDSWSDKEFYFDLPNLFVDFVIEIMNKSILE